MQNFNPALMQTQRQNANPMAALSMSNNSIKQLNDVLLNAQQKRYQRDKAKAIVDANALANENKVNAATVNNSRLNDMLIKKHNFNLEDAEIANNNAVKLSKLNNNFKSSENAKNRKSAKNINSANINSQQTIANNKLSNSAFNRDENFKNQQALIKLQAQLRPSSKGINLTKDTIKLSQDGGGLDGLVDGAIASLNDKDLAVRGLDDTSRGAIRGLLIQKLQDPKEQLKFNLNPTKYTLNLMDSSGEYDWNFHPSNLFTSGGSVFQRQWNPDSKK